MNKKPVAYFSYIIGLVWLAFIVFGYIFTHFEFENFLFSYFWILFVVFTYVCLAGGIGKKFLPSINLPSVSEAVIQVLLGFGILSLSSLILGSIWRINNTIVAVLLFVVLLIFCKSMVLWLKSINQSIVLATSRLDGFEKSLFAYLFLIFFIQLLQSLAPPIKYDALIYHLTLPKIYLQQNQITDIPWLVMSGMPQIAEMLYLNVVALAGESASLILNWFFGILTSVGLFGYLKENTNTKSALVGVTSLFSGFTLVSSLSWGYVDWAGCMFGLGMVVCLSQFFKDKSGLAIFLSGLFSGLAFGTKYPAGALFLCGFLALSWIIWKNKYRYFEIILKYCCGAAISASPWIIKNIILTGNPLYPFFFESGSMDSNRIAVYQGLNPYGNLLDIFLLPIRATIQGLEGTNGYSVSIGPLFLGLSILAILGWENIDPIRKKQISFWGLFSLFGIFIWIVANQFSGYLIQTRFYYSLFPAFSILAAYGYENLTFTMGSKKGLKFIANAIILVIISINLFQISKDFVKKGTLPYLFNLESRQTFLERNLGWYALSMKEINNLPTGSKILNFFEPRGFECVPKCDPDEILDHWKIAYSNYSQTETIQKEWVNAGFTHILVYKEGIEFLKDNPDPHHPINELLAFESVLAEMEPVLDFGGVYTLYQLEN